MRRDCQSQGRKKKSFIFALQRFFPLLGGVIRVGICTNHLLSDTLPSLAQSQYCIDGPPKSITSSLQTNKGSNQHANLLGKAWHAKKQFTTFFAKIKQKLGTVGHLLHTVRFYRKYGHFCTTFRYKFDESFLRCFSLTLVLLDSIWENEWNNWEMFNSSLRSHNFKSGNISSKIRHCVHTTM